MNKFYDLILQDDYVRLKMEQSAELFFEAETVASKVLNGENVNLQPGILPLLVCKNLTDFRFEEDKKLGIDEKITIETLKDVNIWRKRYFSQTGNIGTGEFKWLMFSYSGKIYRIGRLQYEKGVQRPWMKEQCNILQVHIPEGEPLDTDKCEKSMYMATEFYKNYFPLLDPKYFTCESWLLCPDLEKLLPESSNMVRFMRMWTKDHDIGDHSFQSIQRTFGFDYNRQNYISAPENTALQRNLKRFLSEGNEINEFAGYIRIGL